MPAGRTGRICSGSARPARTAAPSRSAAARRPGRNTRSAVVPASSASASFTVKSPCPFTPTASTRPASGTVELEETSVAPRPQDFGSDPQTCMSTSINKGQKRSPVPGLSAESRRTCRRSDHGLMLQHGAAAPVQDHLLAAKFPEDQLVAGDDALRLPYAGQGAGSTTEPAAAASGSWRRRLPSPDRLPLASAGLCTDGVGCATRVLAVHSTATGQPTRLTLQIAQLHGSLNRGSKTPTSDGHHTRDESHTRSCVTSYSRHEQRSYCDARRHK